MSPHGPVDPPEPYDELYPLDEIPMPEQRPDADDPDSPKGNPEGWWDDPEDIRRWRSHYWGLVTFIDDMVERLVETLEERGLREDTMIVFTSDHGEMFGDYNDMAKGNFYEEVIRVPTIVVPPENDDYYCAVDRVDGLVEISDLAPTILDYAGLEVPDVMPTRSLRPFLEGETDETPRDSVLCEYEVDRENTAWKGKCLRTERYKYVTCRGDRGNEFYDLEEDPEELHNRIDDPDYREEMARHRELLVERLMESDQHYYRDRTPSNRDLRTWLK